ncbi:MAG: hypothetical protein AB8B55_22640 [Mariniblastus sp.]
MHTKSLFSLLVISTALVCVGINGDLLAQDLTGIKCIVNGKKSAEPESFVEYQGGKVYFCCSHCVETFKEDLKLKKEAKYTMMANHQLVVTGQFVQKGCPMSGSAIEENLTAKVGATKVGFCCEGCRDKVANAETLEEKAKMVFSHAAFKNAFEKKSAEISLENVTCMMMPKRGVLADQSVEHAGGKVFFCCKGCVKKFNSDPEKYTTQANQQLATTGQFAQTACPVSGGEIDDEQASEFAGMSIKFCCEHCKSKFDDAKDDAAKSEMIFGKDAFSKAFTKK